MGFSVFKSNLFWFCLDVFSGSCLWSPFNLNHSSFIIEEAEWKTWNHLRLIPGEDCSRQEWLKVADQPRSFSTDSVRQNLVDLLVRSLVSRLGDYFLFMSLKYALIQWITIWFNVKLLEWNGLYPVNIHLFRSPPSSGSANLMTAAKGWFVLHFRKEQFLSCWWMQ